MFFCCSGVAIIESFDVEADRSMRALQSVDVTLRLSYVFHTADLLFLYLSPSGLLLEHFTFVCTGVLLACFGRIGYGLKFGFYTFFLSSSPSCIGSCCFGYAFICCVYVGLTSVFFFFFVSGLCAESNYKLQKKKKNNKTIELMSERID